MFNKEYAFRGKHAQMVKKLTAKFDANNNQLFTRNVDIYIMAPIVGFLYGKKVDLDKSSTEDTKIFTDTLLKEKDKLEFSYKLITLLNNRGERNIDNRIERVFKLYETNKRREENENVNINAEAIEEVKEDEENFEQYVRGGIEILYDKLIEKSDDYVKNLYDFIEEFDNRYSDISSENIIDLCTNN